MRKAARWPAIAVGVYVVLALTLDGLIGFFQPQFGSETVESVVIHTFDADGERHTTVLAGINDNGQLWVQSIHHFRGWYYRILESPDIEVVRDGGDPQPYRTIAMDMPEAKEHLDELIRQGNPGFGYYAIRFIHLFADIKPVKLDPR